MKTRKKPDRFAALVEAGFKDKIKVRTTKGSKHVERLEVMVLQQVMGAVKGEKKGLKFVLAHLKKVPPPPEPSFLLEILYPDGSRIIPSLNGRDKLIDKNDDVSWTTSK